MPGLLDFTSDPQGMQGMALLAAAAPSMTPMNFAGRLAQAGSTYQGLLGDQTKLKLGQAQLAEASTKNQLQQFQLQRLKDWQSLLTGGGAPAGASSSAPAFGPNDIQSPGAFMPAADGMGPVAPLDQAPAALTAPQAQGFQFGLRGMPDANSRAVAASMTPDEYMKLYATQAAPQTDIEKLMAAQGIDKSSPLGQQLLSQAIKKTNNIPLQPGRAGAPMYDGEGNIVAFSPKIPDNAIPQIVNGRVTGVSPLPGAAGVAQINAFAGAAGKNQAEPITGYRGNQPVFTNKFAAAGGGGQPAPSGAFDLSDPALLSSINDIKDPQQRATVFSALQAQLNAGGAKAPIAGADNPVTPAPQLGAEKGATLSQSELSDKGKSLMADNSNTNTVISRLQNIKMLAPGAITGAESGRRDFFNGLLSLAGIKGATDAKTASDLVDKNQAQIVTALRMGQGGAGTDALQTLLGSANPNRHMTKEAINEAVDQLIASQKMVQAKAQLLQPHYLNRDPVAYGAKELQFDTNADPRVWQLQSMNPQQQAAYVKSLPPTMAADLLKKRQALKSLGVLQ